MKCRVLLLTIGLMVSTAPATSWDCPEEQPACPAPLSLKIFAVGLVESIFLLQSLPALSENRVIRGAGGVWIASSGAVFVGSSILESNLTPRQRAVEALIGAGLLATGVYGAFAPDSHSKGGRFAGSFLGQNAAVVFGLAIPLLVF